MEPQQNENEKYPILDEISPNMPPAEINFQPNPQPVMIDKPSTSINKNIIDINQVNPNQYPIVELPIYNPPPQEIYQPNVQPAYGTNIMINQQQPLFQGGIVVNQVQPIFPQQTINVHPINMICLFCKKPMITMVEKKCNCFACCLCFILGGLCYFIIQAVRGKDLCCNDAIHRCPFCNNVVGTYVSI